MRSTDNDFLGGDVAFRCFLGDCLVDVAADFDDFVLDFADCLCSFVVKILGSFDSSAGETSCIFSGFFDSASNSGVSIGCNFDGLLLDIVSSFHD